MANRVDSELSARLAAEVLSAYLAHTTVDHSELAKLILETRRAFEVPVGGGLVAPDVSIDGAVRRDTTSSDERVADILARAAKLGHGKQNPAVPVEKSITEDYIVSLEDGKQYRSLRRHLMSKYGMTPEQYRAKWSLPSDYPMVAPSYARERSEVARRIGLGGNPAVPKGRGLKHSRK